jgi:hypothetical protein
MGWPVRSLLPVRWTPHPTVMRLHAAVLSLPSERCGGRRRDGRCGFDLCVILSLERRNVGLGFPAMTGLADRADAETDTPAIGHPGARRHPPMGARGTGFLRRRSKSPEGRRRGP